MSRKLRLEAIVVLLAALALSCSGDSVTTPPTSELTGTWQATEVEYTGAAGTVELIAAGGTATFVINANQTFVYTVTPAGEAPEVIDGSWTASGDTFTATPTGSQWGWTWTMTLTATTLDLTGAQAEYDLDSDGQLESATWNLALTR